MLYLIAEDEYYYTDIGQKTLKEIYDITRIDVFPDKQTIKERIGSKKTAFMAPYHPSAMGEMFHAHSFFEIIYLKNKHGFLTTGQKRLQIPQAKILEEKLGTRVHEPKTTLADYSGASFLIDELMLMEQKVKYGQKVYGFMLTGIPGTGKSFFAKCAAGETGRKLIELNISMFMEKENGLKALSDFFDFFKENAGRYILWIDEIEKMLVGKNAEQTIGLLLSRINDLNDTSDETSLLLIATANNISDLASKNPEFFRNGRFDVLVFILNPTQENAENIFDLYINKGIKEFRNTVFPNIIKNIAIKENFTLGSRVQMIADTLREALPNEIFEKCKTLDTRKITELFSKKDELQKIFQEIEEGYRFKFDKKAFMLEAITLYGDSVVMTERYVHTPAEIEYIVNDMFASYYFSPKESSIVQLVQKYQPLQISMKDPISRMLGVADKFLKV